jgi:hypothetical protein
VQEMASTNPKAGALNIKEIIDSRFVKELEDGGFITSLYKNKLLLLKCYGSQPRAHLSRPSGVFGGSTNGMFASMSGLGAAWEKSVSLRWLFQNGCAIENAKENLNE